MTQPPLILIFFSAILIAISVHLVSCSAPSGNATDGKRWYLMHNCSSCHGINGNDGRAPNIADTEMGYRSFVRKLRTKGATIMPYFPESKISKQDAADIYSYLKNVKST